jgi:hypothetical protein
MASNDSRLLAIVSTGSSSSFSEVMTKLRAIDAQLEPGDGLVWFNRLYGAMTAAVIEAHRKHTFEDPLFVERLDCAFAELYFDAVSAELRDPGTAAGAWRPLFGARYQAGLLPVQLAIAGVNAHINRDLPVALVETFMALGSEPDRSLASYTDYQTINQILESVQAESKTWLRSGVLARADGWLGAVDDVLEMWSLRRAREAAWVGAEVRWALRSHAGLAHHHLEALDKIVGFAGRGLLRPAYIPTPMVQ